MGGEIYGTKPGLQVLMTLSVIFILSAFFFNPAMSKDGDIGANCTAGSDSCTNALAICDNGTCSCNGTYTANLEKQKCEASYNEYCVTEAGGGGCSILNSVCKAVNTTKRCLCMKDYTFDKTKTQCVGKGTALAASVLVWIVGAAISITFKWRIENI